MSFEEIWSQVQGLPQEAINLVPEALTEDTKRRLCNKTPEEVAEIVRVAINEVNHGPFEPLDALIGKRL